MSLARIPFTAEDEGIIRSLGGWMLFIAIVHFIIGGLLLICGCFGVFGAVASIATQGIAGILMVVMVAFLALIAVALIGQGVLLVQGRTAFRGVADTDHADQQFLAEAFGKLKTYFLVEVVVGGLGLVMTIIQIVNVLISDVPPGAMMGPGAGGGFGGGM